MARDDTKLKLEQTEELLRPFRRLSRAQSPRGGWWRAHGQALVFGVQRLRST